MLIIMIYLFLVPRKILVPYMSIVSKIDRQAKTPSFSIIHKLQTY